MTRGNDMQKPLFDVSEFAPEDNRKRKKKPKPPAPPKVDETEEIQAPPPPQRLACIGRLSDSGRPCCRCGGDEWDIDDDFDDGWLAVACAYCGLLETLPRPHEWGCTKVRFGQFAGLTVEQALATGPVALKILSFMAKTDPQLAQALARVICETAS